MTGDPLADAISDLAAALREHTAQERVRHGDIMERIDDVFDAMMGKITASIHRPEPPETEQ